VKWLAILLWCMCSTSFAQIEVTPIDTKALKYPGDVVDVDIKLADDSLVNKISPKTLRQSGSKKTFLVMSVSPLQKNENGWHMQGRFVMGAEFRPDDIYAVKTGEATVELKFRGWNWSPKTQEIEPELQYNTIPLLIRTWWYKNWGKVIVALSVLALLGVGTWLKVSKKRREKKRLEQLRGQWLRLIDEAKTLSALSEIWLKRDELNSLFPENAAAIRSYFSELHRVQFAKTPDENEVATLVVKRRELLSVLKGGTHGA